MTVQTKAQLTRLVASLERQNKKLRKRIAELETSLAEVERVTEPAHVTPQNAFPWEQGK